MENLELNILAKLYMMASPSGEEKKMRRLIKRIVRTITDDAVVETDGHGNLFVTKGNSETYPCVVAHMDEVHNRRYGLTLMYGGGVITGRNNYNYMPEGIGADDKNGIWVALMLIAKYDVCKAAFFVGEEVGCVGSSACNMDFFSDVRFVLQCDRRGGHDFIVNAAGVELSSDEWVDAIGIEKFGYNPTHGSVTDVMELKERGLEVCAANISCGYYNPHSDEESTVLDELENCLHLCCHIFDTMTDVCKHVYTKQTFNNISRGGFGWPPSCHHSWFDDWFDKETIYDSKSHFEKICDRMIDYYVEGDKLDLKAFYDKTKTEFIGADVFDYLQAYETLYGETWDGEDLEGTTSISVLKKN